jgi:hypothetical protein
MFGFKSRRSASINPQLRTRRTGEPLTGIFSLFSRRTPRSDIPQSTIEPSRSQRGTLLRGLREVLRQRKVK